MHERIPPLQRSHRYPRSFKTLRCRTELFRNSFLPFTVNEWNKLNYDIKNSVSNAAFHKKLLAFIRPVWNSVYGIYDPFGVRLTNRLRLDSVIYENKNLDRLLPILWTHYAHALMKLQIQSFFFYTAKTICSHSPYKWTKKHY